MPKRHRQPEPIDIQSTAHHSHHSDVSGEKSNALVKSTTASIVSSSSSRTAKGSGAVAVAAAAAAEKPVYSPGELKLMEETRKKAMDFPATPETLARHRKQQEADAKRRRVSYDRDGQPLTEADASSANLPSSTAAPVRHSMTVSDGFHHARADGGDDRGAEEAEAEDDDEDSDLSSTNYVGDDGNQPSTDSELDSSEDADGESELRGLRKAVEAAAAQRRRNGEATNQSEETTSSGTSSDDDSDGSGVGDDDAEEDEESDDDAFSLEDLEDEEGSSSDEDESMEGDEEDEEEDGSSAGAARRHGEDDDEDEDDLDGGLITVDFGVFDMEKSNIDGVIHLMDQLCPDKMNEVDRDDLGLALYESPFTSVVRLQNNGEDATGEEEQEFYGLASVLDLAHGQQLYPKAMRPLCELLQQTVWRQAASGIPPTDILTSVVDDEHAPTSRAKCLLLISEYIRNIPLELTVQIFADVLDRLDAAGNEESTQKQQRTGATHDAPIFATHPSMLAVLAKVQRATDAPVTLPKGVKQQQQQSGGAGQADRGGETGAHGKPSPSSAVAPSAAAASKKQSHHSKKLEKTGSGSSGAMTAPEAPLDLTHYIFWREEDSVLYEFRDKRVAALVYRCRPQYDGQPEHEIPLSILFVLQYGAMRQAVDEMKRRQTVNAAIERY